MKQQKNILVKHTGIAQRATKIAVFLLTVVVLAFAFISMVRADVTDSPAISVTLLNQNPTPARAGDVMKLLFQIENQGGQPASNLELRIVDDYPFATVGANATQTIPTLAAYQTGTNAANVQFSVQIDKNVLQQSYPLRFQYRYNGGTWTTLSFNINVENKEFAQISYVNQAHIQPGAETPLNFTITNVGSAPLQNLVFSWQEPTGVILPVYSGNSQYIRYLDAGQSTTLSFVAIADVNANPGLYKLNLNLNFESTGDNTTASSISTQSGIFVGGETDFDVVFSQSSQGQTSLSVSNIGNTPAQSVSVSIPPQQNFQVSGSGSAIIGNLNKGDYTLVSFQITPRTDGGNYTRRLQNGTQNPAQTAQYQNYRMQNRTNAGGSGPLDGLIVDVSYTDTTGKRITIEKVVPIQFRNFNSTGTGTGYGRTSASTGFFGSTTFWIILIVIVVGTGFFFYKKNEKKNAVVASKNPKK